jgi:signal transduction histidine kinase
LCSIYLFDGGLDAFAFVGDRGQTANRPLGAVAAHPFTDGFTHGQPWYLRATLSRRARTDPGVVELLALLDAMNADLTLPFLSRGGVVMGWLNLRDEEWSDGFSADEILKLAELVEGAATVLSNIQDFQALEEEHRLAALGAMAAGLAHEIRNPLAGIKGAAQYLQAETLPLEAQEMLEVVIQEADRLNVVVSQFLDYARPFDLERSHDHINAIVTHVLALVRAQGTPAGVQIVERLSGDLPAMGMDRARLSQVLLNLVQNALHAMPHGGVLTVATRPATSRNGQPMIEIAVSDTGVGIAPDDLEKLFIPFFTTKKDGTGLGLAICQRIVQAHGGELDVQSAKGRGATFLVRIPIPQEAVSGEALGQSAAK